MVVRLMLSGPSQKGVDSMDMFICADFNQFGRIQSDCRFLNCTVYMQLNFSIQFKHFFTFALHTLYSPHKTSAHAQCISQRVQKQSHRKRNCPFCLEYIF